MSGTTLNGGGAGTVSIPSTSANNQAYLQAVIAELGTGATSISSLGNGQTAPTVPGGTIGIAVLTAGGSVTIPTGYGLVALTGSEGATLTGGDAGTHILSGLGGLDYSGAAASIIAAGGNNNITATSAAGPFGQFVDVNGSSTVTGNNALIQTEGGASSILALSGNFIVTHGADTVTAVGDNTVIAAGSVGSVTNAGTGDLVYAASGDPQATQTVIAGSGTDVVFAGSQHVVLDGTGSSGTLEFVGGATASTVMAGNGQAILFGGPGDELIDFGNASEKLFVGSAGNYTVDGGNGGAVLFGGAGSNITFTNGDAASGSFLLSGAGSETINAGAGHGNVFIPGAGNATLTGSSEGGDLFQFFKNDAAGSHTVHITDFVTTGGAGQALQFVGYGFNPTFVSNSDPLAQQPTQTVIGGSNNIVLSDHTTIVLDGFGSTVTFTNFNAIG